MSTRTLTYRVCNGCGKDEHDYEIEIVESVARGTTKFDPGTLDLCYGCKEEGKLICKTCGIVHADKSECDFLKALEQAREASGKRVTA